MIDRIGYTQDGLVFIVINSDSEDGKPIQTIAQMPPSYAFQVSEAIREAAMQCPKGREIDVGDSPHIN
jgi:hypothetical protein